MSTQWKQLAELLVELQRLAEDLEEIQRRLRALAEQNSLRPLAAEELLQAHQLGQQAQAVRRRKEQLQTLLSEHVPEKEQLAS
ncbi:MAG TPA: hypothetical protein VGW38_07765 [Chloroflexota bacterium]|nr:hypothetical protein [Chloroflexota bacterium]